jgi:hypothetical protein
MDEEYMGLFLNLPPHLERSFWEAPRTRKQVATSDQWGVLVGVAAHYLGAEAVMHPTGRLLCSGAMALQLLQLLWVRLARDSYSRHRVAINVAQRLRWLLVKFVANRATPGLEERVARKYCAGGCHSGMSALTATTLPGPLLLLLSTLTHALPFRWGAGGGAGGGAHAVHAACSLPLRRQPLAWWAADGAWP